MSKHAQLAPPKIGQNPGFGGGFLRSQNLPGQSLAVGPAGLAAGGIGGSTSLTGPRFDSGPTGEKFVNPGGFTTSLAKANTGQGFAPTGNPLSRQQVNGGVLSVNHNGNPFTSPQMFDGATLRALNDGSLMFGGRQGPVSLQGLLGDVLGRGSDTSQLAGLASAGAPQGPQPTAIAQLSAPDGTPLNAPNAAAPAGVRTLTEANMPGNQASDTGNRGFSPNDVGLNSNNTNQNNFQIAGGINPGLRDPFGAAGSPVGSGGPIGPGAPVGPPQGIDQYPQGGYLPQGGYPPQGGALPGAPGGVSPFGGPALNDQILSMFRDPVFTERIRNEGNNQQNLDTRANIASIFPALQQANPFLPFSLTPLGFKQDGSDFSGQASGPFRNQGIDSKKGGAPLGFATALRFADMLQGADRGRQREGLLAQNAQNARFSAQNRGNEFAANAATNLLRPDLEAARFDELDRRAREDNASSLNNTRNRLQDLGIAGQGAAGAPSILAAERGADRDLQSTQIQLDQLRADERRANLGTGQQALGAGTDIFRALNIDPNTAQALNFATSQNAQLSPFANQLERVGQIAQGVSLSQSQQSNLPGILAAIGGVGGGILGSYGGPAGAAAGFSGGAAAGGSIGQLFNRR